MINWSIIRKLNKGINCTPYFAVFGKEAYNGLEMDSRINGLSSEDFGKIKTTTQLFTILGLLNHLVATESVDRGAADARNLLCYIMSKKTDAFVLGCKAGRLDCVFQWNQLTKCDLATTWSIEDVPDKEISIRSAIIAVSISRGQGVIRCGCKKACSGKCRCLANNQKCNSRCHNGNVNFIQ